MKRAILVLVLALSGCGAITAHRNHGRAPVALYALDVAVFSAGMCVGMDAQFGSPSDDTRTERMIGGYGAALAAWLPYWFVRTE